MIAATSPKTYTIREVADRFGLTLRAIRFYEEKGLVAPARDGDQRLFSDRDLARIERVAAWRAAGLTVGEIRPMLRLLDRGRVGAVDAHLHDRLREIRTALHAQLTEVDRLDNEIATRSAA